MQNYSGDGGAIKAPSLANRKTCTSLIDYFQRVKLKCHNFSLQMINIGTDDADNESLQWWLTWKFFLSGGWTSSQHKGASIPAMASIRKFQPFSCQISAKYSILAVAIKFQYSIPTFNSGYG